MQRTRGHRGIGPRRLRHAAVGLGLVVVAGCLPTPPPWSGDTGPRVGVVGDSLVYDAEWASGSPQLTPALVAAGYRASLTSKPGVVTGALKSVPAFADPGPDLLVVALGTNDMHKGIAITTAIGNLDTYADLIGARCNVFVTIVDSANWGLEVLGPAYNAALADLAAERGDVVIADWATEADAHPEYLVPWDHVHHTAAGQAAYRDLIVDAVQECDALVP